jgi:hypothetical protein
MLPFYSYVAGRNLLFSTTDSEQYFEFYKNLDFESIFDFQFEIGFSYISYLFKNVFSFSYYNFVTFFIFFGLALKMHVFSKYRNFVLYFLLYTLCLFVFFEALIVRASVAIAIVIYAYSIIEKKFLRSLLCLLISILFHSSMAVFILPFLILKTIKKGINIKYVIVLLLFTFIISFKLFDFLFFIPRFGVYFILNPEYFNIWGLPLVLISIISIYFISNNYKNLDLFRKCLVYESIFLTFLTILFYKISMVSIRFHDLAHVIILFLLCSNMTKYNFKISFCLLFVYSFLLLFLKVFDGPAFILEIIKQ